ncbi:TPA: type IV pilus modification protein PilV [Stenotrophomonas maltophilia]|nr:type IV pilus modification protein PilV [Stenotrophomonas maltophilia]HDS1024102.1 type IV pilus modification protein PilV [Stenotrophomonas maltophilia]HDS1028403.1 type IV pilus modification protein PilV [Stenotrophomonas maltophilia]HDS1032865.1 type IV pilus modification protein PilV [Stenotrophomonas maltophilia]
MRARARGGAVGPRSVAGAGLIEVLVAVLLLAIGGLSVAMAQATALRRTQGAMLSTTAVHASASLAEAMRANHQAMTEGAYNTAGELCAATGGPGGSLAQQDLRRWVDALAAGMDARAGVCGNVQCQAGACQVTVSWDDARAAGREGTPRTSLVLGMAP